MPRRSSPKGRKRRPRRRLLDPKNDYVFRTLFSRPENRRCLVSLLTAVLQPRVPITKVEILNPHLDPSEIGQKEAVLDLRARILAGMQVDLEMQMGTELAFGSRSLYYWADLHVSQLAGGRQYGELHPTVGIWISARRVLAGSKFHSVFQLLEQESGERLSGDLELHVLELPNLPRGAGVAGEPAVVRWGRFFAAQSDEELEQVAMNDPELQEAKGALEALSRDPEVRRRARARQLAEWRYERSMALTRAEGEAKGRAEGEAKGRAEGEAKGRAEGEAKGRAEGEAKGEAKALRESLETLCQLHEVKLTSAQRAELRRADAAELRRLFEYVAQKRAWPRAPRATPKVRAARRR